MQVCSRCVMDDTDPDIVFDRNGVCDHCLTFDSKIWPIWRGGHGRELELEKIVEKIKEQGKGKDFDCILGMSGGTDSSYLLHLVVKELGLRPLVFHVDAGWNSQVAVNNIEKLVDKLGLDLFTEVIDWEEMKALQAAYFRSGVPTIDTPQDHSFFATMYKFSSKHNVRNIVTGGNHSTECIRNPKRWMYYQSDHTQLLDIYRRFGPKRKLQSYPVTNILWHKIYLPYVRGIRLHRLLDYMEYRKEEAVDFLVEEYGYQRYAQKHFESRFTKFYESFWLYERFGFDTRKVQFSSLILTGQMSREDALLELQKLPYDQETIEHDAAFIADKLDFTIQELWDCFHLPKRSHRDYRNQEQVYNIGAFGLRWLGKELGGKR